MLVVPFGIDQPDNAARLKRLGVARILPRAKYDRVRAAGELRALLDGAEYVTRAQEVSRKIDGERGAESACDAIESLVKQSQL